ncbi:hypothetical protein GPLA_2864 [Paraglaciecola polaris LMG 21857]|uniref:Uncharacterized protein n=1 Tax=Paraglaciecola polaris LMG 21857 TaxID=1129793 RepID=K6ZYE1_9ALTE|nr:hypothetical protein GPLA_2864 [Paraglaciecola polaris LMG 21857]
MSTEDVTPRPNVPHEEPSQSGGQEPKQTGLIAFFTNNSVAANLMMIFIHYHGSV